MNSIAKEIASYLGSAELSDEEFIEHYGMPRRSGRYPWGSGEDPYQRTGDFLARVEELKKNGWTETPENIKKEFGLNTSQYRREKMICTNERRALVVKTAKALREDGLSNSEIGRRMGVNESTVRSWFNQESESKMLQCQQTADFLRDQIKQKKMIDVGVGVEYELNVSREKLDTALYMLEREDAIEFVKVIANAKEEFQIKNARYTAMDGDVLAGDDAIEFVKVVAATQKEHQADRPCH